MRNVYLKAALLILFSLSPMSMIYAEQNFSPPEKNYVLRVTSLNPSKSAVPFTGSYVVTGKDGYRVISFLFGEKVMQPLKTPYETTVKLPWKVTAISTMIVATDGETDSIKVEIFEKQGSKETSIMSGSGLTIVSTNDANLVFNNIYAK